MTCQEVTAGVIIMVMCAIGMTTMFSGQTDAIVYWLGWAGMAVAGAFGMMTNTHTFSAQSSPRADCDDVCFPLASVFASNLTLGVCGAVLASQLHAYWSAYLLGIALIAQILFWMLLAVMTFAIDFLCKGSTTTTRSHV